MIRKAIPILLSAMLLATTVVTPAMAQAREEPPDPEYLEAIEKTAAMVWNDRAQSLVQEYGLNIVNVTWEDTGRFHNSSVGPNISDLTIQVQHFNERRGDYDLKIGRASCRERV